MAKDDTASSKMKRKDYEKQLRKLQVQLCHLQEWVKEKSSGSLSSSKAATPPARAAPSPMPSTRRGG
jgi:hypothetical protein